MAPGTLDSVSKIASSSDCPVSEGICIAAGSLASAFIDGEVTRGGGSIAEK